MTAVISRDASFASPNYPNGPVSILIGRVVFKVISFVVKTYANKNDSKLSYQVIVIQGMMVKADEVSSSINISILCQLNKKI